MTTEGIMQETLDRLKQRREELCIQGAREFLVDLIHI